jgi:hypothetical protein
MATICRALDLGRVDEVGLPSSDMVTIAVQVRADRADAIRAVLMAEMSK